MYPFRKPLRVFTIACALCLLSACGDSDSNDSEPGSDEIETDSESDTVVHRSETMVNEVDGAVWMACAVGQTWDASIDACKGEPAAVPCEETATACPEGFELPTKNNFQNALCGLIGSMDNVCPHDRFVPCAECDICTALFGQDTGRYPVQEGTVNNGMYVGDMVDFETGCAVGDGYPDTLCTVRCVKTAPDSSTDTLNPNACADATTRESCEAQTGCRALLGNLIDETQNCISTASTFLECVSAGVDCDTAIGYARDPESDECYQFPTLCFPTDWTESTDCGQADEVCEPA